MCKDALRRDLNLLRPGRHTKRCDGPLSLWGLNEGSLPPTEIGLTESRKLPLYRGTFAPWVIESLLHLYELLPTTKGFI